MAAYAKREEGQHFFAMFQQMGREIKQPDENTFVSIFKACARLGKLEQGKQIHEQICTSEIKPTVIILNTIVDMYCRCGSLEDAQCLFDRMHMRDLVSWNVMIGGHAKHGNPKESLKLFGHLAWEGLKPDRITFLSILNACMSLGNLERGKQIHALMQSSGIKPSISIGNALINMYVKCGSLDNAHKVFHNMPQHDVISWNTILAADAKHGHSEKAFKSFLQMEQDFVTPDEVTFLSILNACATLGDLEYGKQLHCIIIKARTKPNLSIENALLDMYTKCGNVEFAFNVFDKMQTRNVVSWSVVIIAHAKLGNSDDAIRLFLQMQWEGVKPNEVTVLSVLCACSNSGNLEMGHQIHAYSINNAVDFGVNMTNAIVDMYAKCGSIMDASHVFDKMHRRDIVSWNVMITGYAQHGYGKMASQLFGQMIEKGNKPNSITFIGILSACSHSGLLSKGCHYFDHMKEHHGIIPTVEHYTCMVDLLGRAGHLEVADSFIRHIPSQPGLMVWRSLLGACKIHGNVELAEFAAESVLLLEPNNAASFVLPSNIYSDQYERREQEPVASSK